MDSFKNQPPPAQETKLHFLDYWRIIRIRKAIIVTVFLITAIIATAVTFILPVSYSSTAQIKIEPDSAADISGMNQGSTYTPYDAYFIQTEFKIMQSEIVLGKVIQALDLNNVWGKKYYRGETLKTDETVRLLKQRINLSPERNTKLINITVYSEDKDDAAKLANAIAKAYQNYRLDLHRQYTQGGIDVLDSQFLAEEQKIRDLQTNVDNLRNQLHINDTDPQSLTPTPTLTQDQLHQLHQQLLEGRSRYSKIESQLNELKSSDPEKLRDILPSVVSDGALSDLLGKLHEARQKFVTLTNDYSPANPEVIRVQSLSQELDRQVSDRVAGVMAGLASQVKSEKAALDAQEAAVEDAKAKDMSEASRGQPYWEAKRQLGSLIEFHKLLAAKIESEKLDLAIPRTSTVTPIEAAKPGLAPVKPNKTLNISLGLIIGLIMGVGLAFFIEYLDTSVKTIDDVERTFQAPVLGVIPQNVGYLLNEGPESKHAEAYRVLRTNILFTRKDEKLNSIVVVSAGAGEGKSTTTLNLATVFAQSGQRILIVDSDLRRPTLHKLMGVTNNLGLTNYLLKQNTLEEVIQTTAVPMLDFLPSGKLPSSSMGILGSAQMREMITELKRRYDFVLFDSPPILGVSDASILASEMDMVVQVIQYRRYPQPMNIRAKQLIEKVGGNFVGIVLNNINLSQDESYYYYSGYYHDYYYTRSEEQQEADAKKPVVAANDQAGIKQKY
jgi:capsular exopolysaccharide synthesis family protein